MGVSFQRMWDAYSAMVEFLEGTDAETYESKFSGPAGGNEWVAGATSSAAGTLLRGLRRGGPEAARRRASAARTLMWIWPGSR